MQCRYCLKKIKSKIRTEITIHKDSIQIFKICLTYFNPVTTNPVAIQHIERQSLAPFIYAYLEAYWDHFPMMVGKLLSISYITQSLRTFIKLRGPEALNKISNQEGETNKIKTNKDTKMSEKQTQDGFD